MHRVEDVGNPWLDAGIVPNNTVKYNSDRDYWKERMLSSSPRPAPVKLSRSPSAPATSKSRLTSSSCRLSPTKKSRSPKNAAYRRTPIRPFAVTLTISTDLIIMQFLPNEKFVFPHFRPKVTNFGRKTVMSGRKTG